MLFYIFYNDLKLCTKNISKNVILLNYCNTHTNFYMKRLFHKIGIHAAAATEMYTSF